MSNNAQHTPGPWCVGERNSLGVPILPGRYARMVAYVPHRMMDDKERAANARLIAAAPDMLQALEEIAAAHVPDQPAASGVDERTWALQHVARLRRIAQAAIAKARGQ